jgi:tetraacyldisaccharide 4'-kinase
VFQKVIYPLYALLSCIHHEIVSLRRYRYVLKSHVLHVGVNTISIGNLQMGGGGKTPFAIKLLQLFKEKKLSFLYSSRAYKSKVENKGLILDFQTDENKETLFTAETIGDEPALILNYIKRGVFLFGKNRKELISKLSKRFIKKAPFEVCVLEDAFQHLSIERDYDLLLIDVTCPVSQFHIFPKGNLRESKIQIWRADYIILSKVNQVSSVQLLEWKDFLEKHKKLNTQIAEIDYVCQSINALDGEKKIPINQCKNRKAVLCSAIANPTSFKDLITKLEFQILDSYELPDHSSFSVNKMNKILDYATQNDAIIICTEKDAVKLKQNLTSDRIYYAKLELKLSSAGEGPWNWLVNLLQK